MTLGKLPIWTRPPLRHPMKKLILHCKKGEIQTSIEIFALKARLGSALARINATDAQDLQRKPPETTTTTTTTRLCEFCLAVLFFVVPIII